MTDILTDHAVEFISAPHEKPFVLYLAHKAVHGPFTPAERHGNSTPTTRSRARRTPTTRWTGKPALTRKVGDRPRRSGRPPKAAASGGRHEVIRNQLRCLRSIDEGVGRILEALEETKQLDNTLVVFTSDNGYFWGEHGLGDKRWAYEESIRIPLLDALPEA